ncbi:hypothetical protein SLEP1_g26471 [Rubroshorea leprosula]|uniref:Fe2OG dioxygenase domain-containing protein n=1 Tax=Rubroshorea leprosula TaxID=152421 RepID=A0AAV5JMD1_9ROSI|nr:hypothetical protein SLEP1_g26471 [Rubroshorea leprosula]
MANFEPPFQEALKTLSLNSPQDAPSIDAAEEEFFELPLIHLRGLNGQEMERKKCIEVMARASREWGFFQIVDHGIPGELLKRLMSEQKRLFYHPFEEKSKQNFLNLANSYLWINPRATSLKQLSWSEAFRVSITDLSRMDESNNTLRQTIEDYAREATLLLQRLAEHLAEFLGMSSSYFRENCPPSSTHLRLNRYPPCPLSGKLHGLVPHTDSSFLTLVYQDQVGGLQLMKHGRWFSVKPASNALIINVGDLFQAMSNDVYKSVRHRVVAQGFERFSAACFYCPTAKALIQGFRGPAVYRPFTYGEYKEQIQEDVKSSGDKVGLPRFLQH